MKKTAFFIAMIFSVSLSRAQICHADFSYSENYGTVYFTNLSTPVDSINNYSWSFGDGGTSDQFNPYHVYATSGLYAVCLTMTNGFLNCSSTFCDTINVDTTNANNSCNASFTYSIAGHDVNFYNTSSWDSGTVTFLWNFGDGETSSDFQPSHHYNNNGSYYACLTISTSYGCSSYECSYIEVLDSNCNITFTVQIDGSNVSFIPSNANYGMGTYDWTFGDNSSSSDIAPTHHYNYPGAYVVCLSYNDSSCSAFTCDSIYISSADSCYAEFYSDQYSNTVYFHPFAIDYSKTYTWNFGDGNSSSDISPNHQYTAEGMYEVCLTVSSFLCSSTFCDSVYFSNDTTNNNGGNCEAYFEVSSIDTAASTVWLTDYSTGGIYFHWDFGDSTFSNDQYPTHTYASNGNYYVCETITCDSNMTSTYCAWVGLGDSIQGGNADVRSGFTLNVKADITSGVISVPSGQSLSFYPNPASGTVNIVLPESVKGNATIIFKNEVGAIVIQKLASAKTYLNAIDIHSLDPGLFLIQVIANGKSYTGSLLKQ